MSPSALTSRLISTSSISSRPLGVWARAGNARVSGAREAASPAHWSVARPRLIAKFGSFDVMPCPPTGLFTHCAPRTVVGDDAKFAPGVTHIGSGRLCDHLVDHAAAAVERPIVRTTEGEVGRAVDILIDRAARQRAHRRSDRRWDHLVAVRHRGIERATAVEVGRAADIDGGAGGRRAGTTAPCGGATTAYCPALRRVIDAVRVAWYGFPATVIAATAAGSTASVAPIARPAPNPAPE